MRTLQELPLIYCAAISAMLKTHSPSSLPHGIALTSHMWMGWEYGYDEMNIYNAEHIAVSSFRTIRLCTQTIFQLLFKPDYRGIFLNMIQLPLFIRQELNVSGSHHHFYMLSLLTHMPWTHTPVYSPPVLCVRWVCNGSVTRAGLSPLRPPVSSVHLKVQWAKQGLGSLVCCSVL